MRAARPSPRPLNRPTRAPHRGRWRLPALAAGTVVAVLLGAGLPSSAQAAVTTGTAGPVVATSALPAPGGTGDLRDVRYQPDSAQFQDAVRLLQPYVHRTRTGTFRIDAPRQVRSRIPAAVYDQVVRSSSLVNEDIRAGRLLSLAGGRVLLPTADLDRAAGTVRALGTTVNAAATPSANGVTVQWWGVVIHLDAATTSQLIAALAGAATAASILSFLVTAGVISSAATVPLAVISGVLALVSGALTACQGPGGTDISLTWFVFGWCTAIP